MASSNMLTKQAPFLTDFSHFTEEKTEGQRRERTCPSEAGGGLEAAEPGGEPRPPQFRVQAHNSYAAKPWA